MTGDRKTHGALKCGKWMGLEFQSAEAKVSESETSSLGVSFVRTGCDVF